VANKLTKDKLDLLIEQVINEQEKGGVETKKAPSKKDTKNLGLDLAEIANILVTGTETKKIIKSSDSALKTLIANANITFDFSSSQALIDSFKFFDFKSEEVLKEKCSSLGGLMSKMALSAGLISIIEYFNSAAAGFVNEAFLASLMGGQSVPVGAGGIEDLYVESGGKRVGVSLKVKASPKLGGSFGQLLETLGIPYYLDISKTAKNPVRRIREETEVTIVETTKGKRVYVKPPENPINDGGLYYLTFLKTGDSISINAFKITSQDIIKSNTKIEDGYYSMNGLNKVLDAKLPKVADKASYALKSSLKPEEFNKVLQREMSEVFQSLTTLDGWYGELKEKLISYVSTLEKTSFETLQSHLSSGAGFTFKAFSVDACKDNMMQENKTKSIKDLDKLIERVILDKMSKL
jgi:hypothetical protein